jgi:hypothetical protein
MPDLSTITTALAGIKAAMNIAELIKENQSSLAGTELKLKLADLLSSLADAKIQLVEAQNTLIERDKRISELEEAFQAKDTLTGRRDVYYKVDEQGKVYRYEINVALHEV